MGPEPNHSVGHVPQPAGEPLAVVAHGPSPHVFGQGSKHMAAACCFGDSFQHGAHFGRSGPGKGNSCGERERRSRKCHYVFHFTFSTIFFLENKVFRNSVTGDAFGHLSGVTFLISLMSTDPSTRPVGGLWIFCRCVRVRQASITSFTCIKDRRKNAWRHLQTTRCTN